MMKDNEEDWIERKGRRRMKRKRREFEMRRRRRTRCCCQGRAHYKAQRSLRGRLGTSLPLASRTLSNGRHWASVFDLKRRWIEEGDEKKRGRGGQSN